MFANIPCSVDTEEGKFQFQALEECKTRCEQFYYDRTQKIEIIEVKYCCMDDEQL